MAKREALLLVVTLLAAGCAGADPTAGPAGDSDAPSDRIVEPEPGIRIAENRGALRGEVLDDAGLALKDARVSLLGRPESTATDPKGRFLFLNLTVGSYQVQAVAPTFSPAQLEVVVSRGNVSNLTFHLLPEAGRGAGYSPHVHDFWNGLDTYLLMDGAVDASGDSGAVRYTNVNETPAPETKYRIRLPVSEPGHPSIIIPGTASIQITLRFTSSQTTLSKLGVRFARPGESSQLPNTLAPHASGVPWTVPVKPEEADSGHQLFTYWIFALCPCNDPRSAPNYEPGAMLGPVNVKIELKRGNVVLDPPHPDFWGGETQRVLLPGEWKTVTQLNVNERSISMHCLLIPKPTLVAPGTDRLTFEFRWKYNTGNGTPLDRPYALSWRTADQDPARTTFAQFRRGPPKVEGDHYVQYEIRPDPTQLDSYYQPRTNWCWMPAIKGEENEARTTDFGRGLQVWLRVVAFRDDAAA